MGINYKKLINEIVDKKISTDDILNENWKNVSEAINSSKFFKTNGRDGLANFLIYVQKKSNFFEHSITIQSYKYFYINGLIKIYERKRQWRNDYKNWKPKSHNRKKQFSELLYFLFGKYKIPKFMDNVWLRNDKGSYRYRNWYIKLTNGENLRKQKSRIKITKKIAHYFGTAPEEYSVEEAIIWGIVLSLGGNKTISSQFHASRPFKLYENIDFWISLIKFFINNSMIDKKMISPIIDFINYQKFENSEVYQDGEIIIVPPPQPNFNLSRRSPNNLLKLVEKWHGTYKKNKLEGVIRFKISNTRSYFKKQKNFDINIKQLTSNYALYDEGDKLGHCIGSYVSSCVKDYCTIWSYYITDKDINKKQLTIEVSDKEINEVRGKFNRFPTKTELTVIKKWAKQEGLILSPWVISNFSKEG